MENQAIVNYAIGLFLSIVGFIVNVLYQLIKDLFRQNTTLNSELHELKNSIGENYLKRVEFQATLTAIFAKLDRIEDKLDKKVDK